MSSNHWSRGLLEAIADPKGWLVSTKDLVTIKDKFSKAKYHFLVVPLAAIDSIFDVSNTENRAHRYWTVNQPPIDNFFALFGQLTRDDVDMLREMEFLAQNVIQVHGRTIDEFKIGYHAKPSMQRLHLHVISRDFHSPCLKTKKHWNSFNTPFLLSTECK